MDNVIEFTTRASKSSTASEKQMPEDAVTDFIRSYLLPWAIEQGLDIHSKKFKLNGATIMTCIQGMLLDDI